MKKNYLKFILLFFLVCTSFNYSFKTKEHSKYISYEVDLKKQHLKFYWKDKKKENYRNFQELKEALKKDGHELVFAMNGGMYNKDLSPQGLYIEKGIVKSKLDTAQNGYGNFYLQPNGIFFITDKNIPHINTTQEFTFAKDIAYATQSGPMLLINGKIHDKFNEGSPNVHIRNGVGILPNGNLLFAMSKEKVNFFDFSNFFKEKGCKNALYLDGFVSKTYLPSKNWEQLDGEFGVIIGEIK
ncbi:phosphodiester glycosidase family protein [Aquimarina litoralis]|uniref:phosphodiester glycosidase family protein n=1 Tax=Aquimarina litoralis TaxID=584605 RepID=UPI001C560D61|nr:phosphodiester glycosidase family protein [Aquimarina litoralis]MBW1294085.1 hypothetical protein [Aquimarina litoralis]